MRIIIGLLCLGTLSSCSKTADVADLKKNELFFTYRDNEGKLEVFLFITEGTTKRCRDLKPSVKGEVNGVPFTIESKGGWKKYASKGGVGYTCDSATLSATISAPADNLVSVKLFDDKDTIEAQYELKPHIAKPIVLAPKDTSALKAGDEVIVEWPIPSKDTSALTVGFSLEDMSMTAKFIVEGQKVRFTLPELPKDWSASESGPMEVWLHNFYDFDTQWKGGIGQAKSCKGISACSISYGDVTNSINIGTYATPTSAPATQP